MNRIVINTHTGPKFFDYDVQENDHHQYKLASAITIALKSKIDISGIIVSDIIFPSNTDLSNSNFNSSSLQKTSIHNGNMSNCDLENCDFSKSDFTNTNFSKSNIQNVNFTDCNLENCNFTEISMDMLSSVNFTGANLVGAKFDFGTIKNNPIYINGLDYRIMVIEEYIMIGCKLHHYSEWETFNNRDFIKMGGKNASIFCECWIPTLVSIAKHISSISPKEKSIIITQQIPNSNTAEGIKINVLAD